MKVIELEVEREGALIDQWVNAISNMQETPESVRDIFSRLHDDGYGKQMDYILATLYGDREVRDGLTVRYIDGTLLDRTLEGYLRTKASFFQKCLAYIDAEYNPVENYMGVESETIINTIGERHSTLTDTDEPKTIETDYDTPQHQKNVQTPEITVTESSDTDIVKEKTELKTTTETKVAPFESSEYFNKEKVEVTPGKVTETEKPYERETSTSQHTVTETEVAHIDKVYEKHLADEVSTHETNADEAEDVTERNFNRHGNIGVLSAGELMQKDMAFWKDFAWIRDTAHDIANLISVGVWAL